MRWYVIHTYSGFENKIADFMMEQANKKGFTLVEVNLAIFIMAVGVLSMCGLYSLGYRENRQSVEDVASAALKYTFSSNVVSA